MDEHVVVKHPLYCRTASTAQQNANSPHKAAKQVRADQSAATRPSRQSIYRIAVPQPQHSTAHSARTKPQSKYVPIRVRQHKQADKVCESQHKSSSIYRAHLVLKTKKSNSARPTETYNYSHSASVMREGFAICYDLHAIQHCSSFSSSFLCMAFRAYMRRATSINQCACRRRVVLSVQTYLGFSMSREAWALPSATGPPTATRPRHARPTGQHKVLSTNERAPMPSSASGGRRKEQSPVPDMVGDRENMETSARLL